MSQNAQWNNQNYPHAHYVPPQQQESPAGQVKMFDPSQYQGNQSPNQQYQQPQQPYLQGSSGTDGGNVSQTGYGLHYQNQPSTDDWDQSWNNQWDWSQNDASDPANGVPTNNWNSQPQYQAAGYHQQWSPDLQMKSVGQTGQASPQWNSSTNYQGTRSQSSTPQVTEQQWKNQPQTRQTPQSWDTTSQGSVSQPSTPAPTSTATGWDASAQGMQQNWGGSNQQPPQWQNHNHYQGQGQFSAPDGYHQQQAQQSYDGSVMASFYENDDGSGDAPRPGGNAVESVSNQFSDINLDDDSAAQQNQEADRSNASFPTSNSFSNLQHQPSPFDEIDSIPVVANTPNVSSIISQTLDVTTQSKGYNSHSRNSSVGGNVQFIIGSGPNSASHSPYGSQNTSHNHSPEVHETPSSGQHPSHLPVTTEGHDEMSAASGVQQTPDEGAAHHDLVTPASAAMYKGAEDQRPPDGRQQIPERTTHSPFVSHPNVPPPAAHVSVPASPPVVFQPMAGLASQQSPPPPGFSAQSNMIPHDSNQGHGSSVPQSPLGSNLGQAVPMYGTQPNAVGSDMQRSPFQQVFRPPSVQSNHSTASDPHHHQNPPQGNFMAQSPPMSHDHATQRSPFQQQYRPPSVQSNQSNVSDQNQIQQQGGLMMNQPFTTGAGTQPNTAITGYNKSPFQQVHRSPSVQSNQGSSVVPQGSMHVSGQDVPFQQIQRSPSVHSNQSCHADPVPGSGYQNVAQRPSSALSSQSSESSIAQYTAMANKPIQQQSMLGGDQQLMASQVSPPKSLQMAAPQAPPSSQNSDLPVMSQPVQNVASPPQVMSPPTQIYSPSQMKPENYQNNPAMYSVHNSNVNNSAAVPQVYNEENRSVPQPEIQHIDQANVQPQIQTSIPNDQPPHVPPPAHMMNIYTSAIQPHVDSPFKPLKKSQDTDSPQNFNQNILLNPPVTSPAVADTETRSSLPKNYPQNMTTVNQTGIINVAQPLTHPQQAIPANVPSPGSAPYIISSEPAQQNINSQNNRQGLSLSEIPPANQQQQQQVAAANPALQAHVHLHQWHREDNNMSPAATLWKNPEPPKSGVVLAPATPTPTSHEGSPVRSPNQQSAATAVTTTQPQMMRSGFSSVKPLHENVISQKDNSQVSAEMQKNITQVPAVDNANVNVNPSFQTQDLNSTAPFSIHSAESVQSMVQGITQQSSGLPDGHVKPQEPYVQQAREEPKPVDPRQNTENRNSGDGYNNQPSEIPFSKEPPHEEQRDSHQTRSQYDQYEQRSRQGHDDYDYRPRSRQGNGQESNDRPSSRQGYDESERSRQGYRDNRERSRSRQGEYYDDRPRSRQGYEDDADDRSRSRYGYGYEDRSRPRTREGRSDRRERSTDRRERSTDRRERSTDRRERSTSRSRYPERPHSRSGSRPPSRSDYDDYYSNNPYYRARAYYRSYRYRGDYDNQYGYGYYDYNRDPYYDDGYYRDPHRDRVSRGYYDEMQYYNQNYTGRDQQYDSRYQDYYKQQQQYGSAGYDDVDRHSSHSRSSSRGPSVDDYDGTGADNFARDFHGQGSRPSSRAGYEAPDAYSTDPAYTQAYHDQSYDYSAYDYNAAYQNQYIESPPERRTPVKFSIPHVRASFGPSNQLLKVLPNRPADGQPALVEVHDLDSILPQTTQTQELKTFTGPLVKGETHKNDVLAFCHNMMRECREDASITDRESAELMWRLLELLIKQNGTIIGTDIAELLLDGRMPTTDDYAKKGITISASTADLDQSNAENLVTTSDKTVINKNSLSTEEVTDRFRHLLLYGRKKDALDWAMKNYLWGHALFLASKMDNRTHANVMTKFANSSMRMNDPLQTLYQLMSTRQPAAVTCITDERWGDWRPHLAMILSNPTYKPELDRKSVVQLGDTLASRRCLHASQFCYLMAQCNFGAFSKKTSKLVLIGSSHVLPWELFANNRAIQCTEVYEYAISLGSPFYTIPTFQIYKFIYATRLAECGMIDQALHYCEIIANAILQVPVQYPPVLFKQLYELGNRMKYSDPQLLLRAEDEGDPYWLQQLLRVSQCFDDGTLAAHPLSGSETPMGFGSTATGSENGDIVTSASEMTPAQYQATFQGQTEGQTEGQKAEESQYQQENTADASQQNYNNQYTTQQEGQAYTAYGQDTQQQSWAQDQSALYNSTAYGAYPGYAQDGSYIGYTQTIQDPATQQQKTGEENQAPTSSSADTTSAANVPFNQYSSDQTHQPPMPSQTYNANSFQQFAQKLPNSGGGDLAASATSMTSTSTETTESTDVDSSVSPKPFDYYAASTQQAEAGDNCQSSDSQITPSNHSPPPVLSPPTRAPPIYSCKQMARRTSIIDVDEVARARKASSGSNQSKGSATPVMSPSSPRRRSSGQFSFKYPPPPLSPTSQQMPPPAARPPAVGQTEMPGKSGSTPSEAKTDAKSTDNKNKRPKQGGSGWLGGLFNKSWFRGKNEMILPEDKNPSIIWDPVAKRWKNMDGDEEDTKPALPPPKDNELNRSVGGPPAPGPTPGATPGATPMGNAPPTGNRFSRQKSRGARGQYVDVLNPGGLRSSATAPSSLFSIMPSSTPPSAQIFTPNTTAENSGQEGQADSTSTVAKTEPAESVVQSQPDAQQSYPPNQQQSYQQDSQTPYQQQPTQPSYQQEQQPSYQPDQQQSYQPEQQQTYQQQPVQQQPTYQQSGFPPAAQQSATYQQQPSGQQQFYNPNQMAPQSNPSSTTAAQPQKKEDPTALSRCSSASSLGWEVQQLTYQTQKYPGSAFYKTQANKRAPTEEPQPGAPAGMPSMPAMYNPSQFTPQQQQPAPGAAASTGARGLRYGQRRAYPK